MKNLKLSLLLFFASLFFCPSKLQSAPKIYDCFLFYNEFELLEVRLNELSDHVDKFVLVEACETFRGKPKPFYFEQNKHQFEKYKDKIIHIKLTDTFKTKKLFERERHQRSQVMRGLSDARPEDIIFISDLDEIIRGSKVAEIAEMISSKKAEAAICLQTMYYGFLNRFQTGEWRGPVCTTYKVMKRISPALTRRLRNLRPRKLRRAKLSKIELIPNAGWHFTTMGGVDRAILKIESFSHAELDTPEYKDKQRLLAEIRSHPLRPIDETFPRYVQDNQEKLKKMGFIDTE